MVCSVDGCEASGKLTKGLCAKHYRRLMRTGSPLIVRPPGIPGTISTHFMYGAWAGMLSRCHNPNSSSFDRYGARGVYVCDRWRQSFAAFLEDMGERPEGMTLDRIDPKGPYAPDNCRWATKVQQRANISPEAAERANRINSQKRTAYWERWRAERAA